MVSDQYREAVERCRALFQPLLWRAWYYLVLLPKVAHLNEQRQRVQRFLGVPHNLPPLRRQRAKNRVADIRSGRTAKIEEYYRTFRRLVNDAHAEVERLRGVLPAAEIHRLMADVSVNSVEGTYRALQRACSLPEEYRDATHSGGDTPQEPNPSGAAQSAAGLKRKQGRPEVIPAERKIQALEAKAAGRSNKDCAKILYNALYPTPQQVKNVPSILNYFKYYQRTQPPTE